MSEKESAPEKGSRWYRNFNAAVGGIAIGASVLVAPVASGFLAAYGAFNLVQAGGGEISRRHFEKKRKQKG